MLWFAWKFVPLWYQQQLLPTSLSYIICCDLLENLYLCGISNNSFCYYLMKNLVVICLKICTFVVSATTEKPTEFDQCLLWFAWKFVPLWYQQQRRYAHRLWNYSCDLLENLYLCGISNNMSCIVVDRPLLWFAWKFVPLWYQQQQGKSVGASGSGCDLLENLYLCGISNNRRCW